jgi:hypothetical protein
MLGSARGLVVLSGNSLVEEGIERANVNNRIVHLFGFGACRTCPTLKF